MDDDSRREILERARSTVARLDDAEHQRWLQHGPVEPPVFQEDTMERWERLRLQSAEPAKKQESGVTKQQIRGLEKGVAEEIAGLNVALRAHVEARIGTLTEMIATVFGEETGRNEKLVREKYDAAIAELRTEIAVLREELNLCKRAAKPVNNLGVTEIIDLDRLEGLGHG